MIVYTLSDIGSMVEDCVRSVRDLRKFTDAPIHVIITPPVPEPWKLDKLRDKGAVKKTDFCSIGFTNNKTEPFNIRPHTRTGRFGEKIGALTMFDSKNVLFLDNDTRIIKNPETLFDHDFDFSARIDNGFSLVNWDEWSDIFLRVQKKVMPLFNAGVMAFKNHSCKKIMDEALRCFQMELPKYGEYYQKDQLAIGLSLGGEYKIRYMGEEDHAFRWLDESHETVIYHGSKRPLIKRVGVSFRKLYNHFS